jgi:hypothetical protein
MEDVAAVAVVALMVNFVTIGYVSVVKPPDGTVEHFVSACNPPFTEVSIRV